MATGPEHYQEAERLVALAHETIPDDEPSHRAVVAVAQVHATLALAAATALNDPDGAGYYKVDRLEWTAAASLWRDPTGGGQ